MYIDLSSQLPYENIKSYLLKKQEQVEEELLSLEKDDPLMIDAVAEPSEIGTDSWQADVHAKVVAVRDRLKSMSSKIKDSLERINRGTYGRCEKCGKNIDSERLEAMPLADLCKLCL